MCSTQIFDIGHKAIKRQALVGILDTLPFLMHVLQQKGLFTAQHWQRTLQWKLTDCFDHLKKQQQPAKKDFRTFSLSKTNSGSSGLSSQTGSDWHQPYRCFSCRFLPSHNQNMGQLCCCIHRNVSACVFEAENAHLNEKRHSLKERISRTPLERQRFPQRALPSL